MSTGGGLFFVPDGGGGPVQTGQLAENMREATLLSFATLTGITGISGLEQQGRETLTARFALVLADGRRIRVGTIEALTSQAKLSNVLLVTLGINMKLSKAGEWRTAIGALVAYACDVEERAGEAFEDTVREWLSGYADRASADKDGAAHTGAPFWDGDGQLHVTATDLAKFVRREYSEQVKLVDLRQALTDLGFQRVTINYSRKRRGVVNRSSASYYRGTLDAHSDVSEAA